MKNVLITGGTGSWGQAMAARLLKLKDGPERIAIYSRGEHRQETMARQFNDDRLRFMIGDIRDEERLKLALRGVDTVFHAAALKIVPTCEYNPFEAVQTNIHGAENLVRASLYAGVQQVVALSTDKAVNPVNLYGSTKLAAEKIFMAANTLAAGDCRYQVVRYGNVVSSQGSVIPLFKELAKKGSPLPVTDERMTRFWITLEQAVDLVLSAKDKPGLLHIPKIPSVRVTDIALAIAPELGIQVVGIRPGEKLHEVLLTEDESREAKELHDRYVVGQADSVGKRVPEGTRYSSDMNNHWLSIDEIKAAL